MEEQDWPAGGRMMDIRLYYEKAGDGEPLIMLHGNGEDGTYFKHQMEYFSKDYRVIAIDTRGHGKSPRGEKPFTIRQFAEDLNGFMEEQGMEKAHLLGFSDGGNIALAFALRYPGKVESLILNGANLCPAGVKPRQVCQVFLNALARDHEGYDLRTCLRFPNPLS